MVLKEWLSINKNQWHVDKTSSGSNKQTITKKPLFQFLSNVISPIFTFLMLLAPIFYVVDVVDVNEKLMQLKEDEEKLIPLLQLDKAIFRAYWYTGELRVGLAEPTYYHSNHQPVYTKELIINVENGKVINQRME